MATRGSTLPPEADEGDNTLDDTLSDHNFFVSTTKFPRRIVAEDPTYNRPEIAHLKTLCLNTLALTYNGRENLKRLTPYEKHYIAKRLPLNFPILTAIRFVSDEIYWQKRCLHQWEVCDLSRYNGSWKIMCLQRTIEQMIEEFDPSTVNVTDSMKQLGTLIVAANKFIKRLEIKKLKAVKHINNEENDKSEEYRLKLSTILANLPHLEELVITFSANDCGEDFDWFMCRLTYDEVISLTSALMPCYNLRIFHLYKSELDCIKVNLLMRGLIHLPSLQVLKLPSNLIGDKGAFCVAKLISNSSKLLELDLSHNKIGIAGGEAIAFALTKNHTLKVLNLRLNFLQDKGCTAISRSLAVNKGLERLNLAANEMGEMSAEIVGLALKFNRTLLDLDLSCNVDIGMVGGVQIVEGLEKNGTCLEMDLRWCNCGQETEYYVDQLLRMNRAKIQA